MAIHKTDDGGFTISSHDIWLPGVYEDERTARYAFRLPEDVLQGLQDQANARGGGVITWGDLAKAVERGLK